MAAPYLENKMCDDLFSQNVKFALNPRPDVNIASMVFPMPQLPAATAVPAKAPTGPPTINPAAPHPTMLPPTDRPFFK